MFRRTVGERGSTKMTVTRWIRFKPGTHVWVPCLQFDQEVRQEVERQEKERQEKQRREKELRDAEIQDAQRRQDAAVTDAAAAAVATATTFKVGDIVTQEFSTGIVLRIEQCLQTGMQLCVVEWDKNSTAWTQRVQTIPSSHLRKGGLAASSPRRERRKRCKLDL